ncbi:MAG: hypothetical protein HLX50_09075 [Alteromonadaceae bacterium]|nr:hypothetical protein [Alteromonadaceae bacterium]
MTIDNTHIVLAESQVMADTEDGGGRMSGNVVEEGAVNNTMPDVSRLDRVYGRVNMRKLFLSVRSTNQDTYLGAHTCVLRNPIDPRVAVTLFQTGSHTDRRDAARDRIESYVVKATEAQFWLWGDQLEGQRAIAALQRVDGTPPETGEVYVLTSEDGSREQYFRVTEVDVAVQTFTAMIGGQLKDFDLQTLQIKMANNLETDFEGSDPYPTGRESSADKILETQVADAARYYGAKTLAVTASPGDLTAQLDSIYNHLVPSAQSETALTDRTGGPARIPVVASSESAITVNADNVNKDGDGYSVYYTGRGIVPGTLTIGGSNGSYQDDGGKIKHTGGSDRLDASEIDYAQGVVRIRWTGSSDNYNPITLTFLPGAPVPQQAYTSSVAIELQNRSLTYVSQLRPIPAPGTLRIEYMALGRWNVLTDRGTGVVEGNGTGRINYATGTLEVTLSALPDVGSEIIYSWGDDQSFQIEVGNVTPAAPELEFSLTETVAP